MGRVLAISLNPALDLTIRLGALRLGEVNRSESTEMDAAGKGNNVARVLAGLGHEVTVSGFLGEANQGAFERAFHDWGVTDAFVRVAGETRVNAKLAESDGRVTDVNGPGAVINASAFAVFEQRLDECLATCDVVVISGSLPPGVTPAQLAALVTRIRDAGVPVWLDTSGAALKAGLAAKPAAAKPNETELAEWAGEVLEDNAALITAARRLNASGIDDVLLSVGAEGVIWVSGTLLLQATPPKVEVVSTVGAGDTLLAAALHGRIEGWTHERTLRFATALSAECVRHVGVGNPAAPDFAELEQHIVLHSLDSGHSGPQAGEMPA
ncbi:1-phosphofructokinase [Phytohalomonas tamaricis]|uniref:1-phosphofructokinase n=1 Tax=Phytohalomonas tamaricis TaxID=2081032 RepID=UPI000D0B73CE|nr:1-phosphofructokinase [Phytohalomonas tamaricis]